jgi:O-antigen/teichoic acid export membrane protein
VYTAATRFLVVGQFVNQAINAPVQPRLSAALAAGDRSTARLLYRVSTTWLVLLSWPLSCVAIVLAPTYLRLFGHGYQHFGGAVTVVVLLGLATLVGGGVGVVDAVITMAGRSTWNLGTTVLALVTNVAVDVIAIPRLGITGAGIGWAASIVVANGVALALAWRRLDLHPFGPQVAAAALLAVVCFLAVPWAVQAVVGGGQVAALTGVLLGGAGYLVAVWAARRRFALTMLTAGRRRSELQRAGTETVARTAADGPPSS